MMTVEISTTTMNDYLKGVTITKKFIAILAAVILMLSLATMAFAAPPVAGDGYPRSGYGFMCDDNGNFLSREAFTAKLDKAIEDGLIRSEDKAYYLEMYDYCQQNGGNYGGRGFGGCCGRGRGF